MQWKSEHYTGRAHGQLRCFSEHRTAHTPRQSGGSSNDFSGRLVPLQPRSINILWGDPGWCIHMNRTLHRYESLPGASRHHVHGLSPSLHISDRAAIAVSCTDATVRQDALCADEGTQHVSGLGSVQLVLNLKGRGPRQVRETWWCSPGRVVDVKRAQFLGFLLFFLFVGSVALILS